MDWIICNLLFDFLPSKNYYSLIGILSFFRLPLSEIGKLRTLLLKSHLLITRFRPTRVAYKSLSNR